MMRPGGHGRRNSWAVRTAVASWVAVFCCAPAPAPAAGDLGQEMRQVQDELLKQKAGAAEKKPGVSTKITVTNGTPKAAAPSAPSAGPFFDIKTLEIRGDIGVLERAGMLDELKAEVEGRKLSQADLRAIAERYGMMLITNQVNGGYLAANVNVPLGQDLSTGKVAFNVTGGKPGTMSFYAKPADPNTPVDQLASNRWRYFSEKQVKDTLAAITNEPYFNYNTFYQALLKLNSNPDLNIDTDLKLTAKRVPGQPEQRAIDMLFKIGERPPLHAVVNLANNGTDVTEEWRAGLTAQHLNLTKHEDVLTISIPVSVPDVSVIQSVAVSYYLPHSMGRGGAFTVYGGYSRLEAENLFDSTDPASQLSSSGRGYFAGFQSPYTLSQNRRHFISLTPGVAYRVVEDSLTLGEGDASIDRNLTLTPLSITLSYSTPEADRFGGRTFLALDTSYNPGDMLGGSGDEEIIAQRAAAKAEYFIERLHFARLQPLAGRVDARGNLYAQWLLFLKAEGQYASEPLIPADQFGLGGLDSVRGYPDRVVLGDDGFSGSVELRTPIISGLIFKNTPPQEGEKKRWFAKADRLQFVTFADAGHITLKEALEGEAASEELYSVGVGFRLQFTENILARADWGFPLGYSDELQAASGDIQSSGRGHFSIQVQF